MPIQFACSCGRKLQASEEHAGRRVKCPSCGAETTVPAGETAVQPAEASPSKPSPVQAEGPRRPEEDDERDGARRRRASRRREEDEEDERPRRRRREDDEDEEDEDRPRKDRQTSGKATAALVLGLLSLCLGLLAGIPAIILGALSLNDISRSRGRLGGKGLAIAGLVLGSLSIVLAPLLLMALLVPAVQKVREASSRIQSQNNLKQMAIAMHNYNDTYEHLPQATPDPPDPKFQPATKLSWRVQLLPYLEQDNLWRQFRQDEPWDGLHNKALLTPMPRVFAHPNHPEDNAKGLTYYRVFVGPNTPFPPGKVSSIPASFPDGTSNTILIVEAADPVPWTKPDELVYDRNKPLPKLGGHFRSGTNAAIADGSVVILHNGLSEQTLRSAIDPNDGLPLGADWP